MTPQGFGRIVERMSSRPSPSQPQATQEDTCYLRFFWPLSLMGIGVLAGRLIQNFVLLGFEEGVQELAWFALALAIFSPFRAGVGLIPQMVTVWSRSAQGRRQCFVFVTLLGLVLSLPVLFLAWLPVGRAFVERLYALRGEGVGIIVLYLRFLAPTLLFMGWRQYMVGLLIRREHTGRVTILKAIEILSVIAGLAYGIHAGWQPSVVVGLSALLPPGVGVVGALLLLMKSTPVADEEEAEPVRLGMLLSYYWPLAGTTLMFTLSRPIIFRLVRELNPTDDASGVNTTGLIAALSLAFSVGMVFQITVNQVRHLMVRYGRDDPAGVRRFILRLAGVVTLIMALVLATPLARLFLVHAQGAQGATLDMALDCLWALVLVPSVIAWRNYYHGLALVHRRTASMVIGGLARNGSILMVGLLLLATGRLTHWSAASLLVVAFAAEGFTVMLSTRAWRAELVN